MQAAINAAASLLPSDLPAPPVYAKVNPADAPILTLAVTSKSHALTTLEDLSETTLVQKISQQPGVGLVSISGGQRPAMRVQIDPQTIAAYGLNVDDIRDHARHGQCQHPEGQFRQGRPRPRPSTRTTSSPPPTRSATLSLLIATGAPCSSRILPP